MIELNGVEKFYIGDTYKVHALKNVNLQINEGEYISIMGKSGSGKTTLLNVLGFLDVPSEGNVVFKNKDLNLTVDNLYKYRKQHIGFVFQHFALINQCTVYENIEMPLLARNYPLRLRKKLVDMQLKRLGIAELSRKYPGQISGGQKQRVAIARALVCNPDILLADEPTGALDFETAKEIIKIFEEINKKGKTIVIVTHDEDIAANAKRHIIIEDGEIVQDSVG